jgi:hypothetical protein
MLRASRSSRDGVGAVAFVADELFGLRFAELHQRIVAFDLMRAAAGLLERPASGVGAKVDGREPAERAPERFPILIPLLRRPHAGLPAGWSRRRRARHPQGGPRLAGVSKPRPTRQACSSAGSALSATSLTASVPIAPARPARAIVSASSNSRKRCIPPHRAEEDGRCRYPRHGSLLRVGMALTGKCLAQNMRLLARRNKRRLSGSDMHGSRLGSRFVTQRWLQCPT